MVADGESALPAASEGKEKEPVIDAVAVSERRANFDRDGFLHVRGFCSSEECAQMKAAMGALVDAWDPDKTLAPVFVTDEEGQLKHQAKSDYFLESADRIHFFLEKGTIDEDGKLKPGVQKDRSLNKVGHGLHVQDETFKAYSSSNKVINLVQDLGWVDPVLPQSMYIFKQPMIGGEVTAHQDSTFLHTTPKPTCLGLWLALDDATLENGCIWARPCSHREPVRRVFVRNPAHFEDGDSNAPQMIFEDVPGSAGLAAWAWEGKMPEGSEPPSKGMYDAGFQPVECKAGDLVVIHGEVDHLSLPNFSEKQRHTFQLHLIEGPTQGITWSPRNWLQYPAGKSFPFMVKDNMKKRKAESASEKKLLDGTPTEG
eukprot:TRINITY_DN41447_c0_g1_i1.p1 TRINITY_DN41447_c0_g1~~TRINITY_DN41447_c0_g1_i1.p1  ORF type:complete len:395 (+),score=70.96 TRINITY_DN41447_c0_g1_i1:78-1187(+)